MKAVSDSLSSAKVARTGVKWSWVERLWWKGSAGGEIAARRWVLVLRCRSTLEGMEHWRVLLSSES